MSGHIPETKPKTSVIHATYVLMLKSGIQAAKGARIGDVALREAEENLTDLLPAGYWVEIHEWDDEKE